MRIERSTLNKVPIYTYLNIHYYIIIILYKHESEEMWTPRTLLRH